MHPQRKHLTPKQTERVAALWHAIARIRPSSVRASVSPYVKAMVFVNVTFPRRSGHFNGRFRFTRGGMDAPTVAALQFSVEASLASMPRLTPKEEYRLARVARRFVERGRVTRAALRDVAMMQGIPGIAVYFAQFC